MCVCVCVCVRVLRVTSIMRIKKELIDYSHRRFGARVLNAPSGRSNCLNAGAEAHTTHTNTHTRARRTHTHTQRTHGPVS